jgi:hypothetical protein
VLLPVRTSTRTMPVVNGHVGDCPPGGGVAVGHTVTEPASTVATKPPSDAGHAGTSAIATAAVVAFAKTAATANIVRVFMLSPLGVA